MNLYEITTELVTIGNQLEENGGELTPELEALLDRVNLDFNSKVENIGKLNLNLYAKEEAIDNEIKRLQAKKKAAQNLQERLKDYLKVCMERTGKKKVEYSTFTVSLCNNPPSVQIEDKYAIPSKYVTVIESTDINKKALLADLKNGVEIPGAKLITDKTHIKVR